MSATEESLPLASRRFKLLGINVDPVTVDELHEYILAAARQDEHRLIPNINVNAANLAQHDERMRAFLNSGDLIFCDGAGIILGARLLGRAIPERITYADWTWQLAAFAEQHGLSLFLLGARPGVVEQAASRLQERFPRLVIAGTQHGYFDKTPGSAENAAVLERINAAAPHILLVGFGMPAQEHWLDENWGQIKANVALTGGAVFDYISGELRRAPRWMTDHGLEWLGRLLIEPRRLWRRYVLGNPLFLARILRERIRGAPPGRGSGGVPRQ